jgi:cytochrome c
MTRALPTNRRPRAATARRLLSLGRGLSIAGILATWLSAAAHAQDIRVSLKPPEVTLPTRLTEVFVADPRDKRFMPPRLSELPNDAYGDLVRRGRNIFVDTQRHAKPYVGNGLNCSNCHLSEGRLFIRSTAARICASTPWPSVSAIVFATR